MVIVRHPRGCLQDASKERNETVMLDKEGRVESEDQEPTTSEDSRATIL